MRHPANQVRWTPVARQPLSDTVYQNFQDVAMVLPGTMSRGAFPITEVRGRADVLACGPTLRELAARCGQRGVTDHLGFQLSVPYFGSKLPSIFFLHSPDQRGADATAAPRPVAAVLLHEYRLLGLRTGTYIPSDIAGDWTVLAPPESRLEVAAYVAEYLLREGARMVLIASTGLPETPGMMTNLQRLVAAGRRPALRTLRLRGTLNATLATMGAHTRRNLRQARRHAEGKLGVVFQSEAAVSEEEFLRISREGFYPVPDKVARWRYRSAREVPGGFMAAVRSSDGDWLALLGGRRYLAAEGACTAIDWQLNHTKYAKFSPGSLLRIFLIEDELERGTVQLRFEGGTPHPMRSAFEQEFVTDLLFARARWTPRWLRRLGRFLPKGNLLGDRLRSSSLVWRA